MTQRSLSSMGPHAATSSLLQTDTYHGKAIELQHVLVRQERVEDLWELLAAETPLKVWPQFVMSVGARTSILSACRIVAPSQAG